MPKVMVELGKRAYLFKDAGAYAASVVISAHGYYLPTTGDLAPGFPTLRFYCQHGGTVDDVAQATGIRNTPATQTVPNGAVVTTTDYQLFKLGEHKATIKAARKRHNEAHPAAPVTFTRMEDLMGGMGGETYGTFRNVVDVNNDYVTIRNRSNVYGGPVIGLGALIALIQAEHHYATIKCAFCRETKLAGFVPNLNADA